MNRDLHLIFDEKDGAVMLVRVFDSQQNVYFKSDVYAIINSGWYEKQLVVFSSGGDRYLKFFDYLEKSNPTQPIALINTIIPSSSVSSSEWMFKRSNDVDKTLDDYAGLLDTDIRFFEYRGYSWIYEDKILLTELLNGNAVSTKGYELQILAPNTYQLEGWNYTEAQEDVNFLLEQTSGFHDSVIKDLSYVSGSYVDDNKAMYCTDSVRTVTIRFDSQWCRSIEMVFEGVTALNLRPSVDNHFSYIYSASLFLRNATIFFCDEHMNDVDKTYEGTWIESYSLRWRFYE